MLQEMLDARQLPPLMERKDMLDLLQHEVYGVLPPLPESLTFEVEQIEGFFCAARAELIHVRARGVVYGRPFSFPFCAAIPRNRKNLPFFVSINFTGNVPEIYMPSEELVDEGFAVLSLNYQDVTTDDHDFTNGLAGVSCPSGYPQGSDAGKIALWAWAAQRVLDWALTRSELDPRCAIVCGHSRLGKTAMLAAATDERFRFCYSNDSGCSGAALSRGTTGETIRDICVRFPYWFCPNYQRHINREDGMPLDQHYLAASIAPRYLLIGSAQDDAWADPKSELLCALAASPAFRKGLVHPDRLPQAGDKWLEGDVGYHMRSGVHYFSREDWHRLMEFVRLHAQES